MYCAFELGFHKGQRVVTSICSSRVYNNMSGATGWRGGRHRDPSDEHRRILIEIRSKPADRTAGSGTRVPPEPESGAPGPKKKRVLRGYSAGPRSWLPAFLVYRPESAPKPTLSDKHEAVGRAKNPEQHPKRKRAPKKPIRRRAPDRTNSEKRRRNDDRDGSIAGAPRRRRCRPPARHRRRSARRRSSRKRTRSRPRREHPTIRFACSRTGTAPDVHDHWAHGDPLTDETG